MNLPRLSWHSGDLDPAQMEIPTDWPAGAFRQWAIGDTAGAGARVCVIDSGVDAGNPAIGTVEGSFTVEDGLVVSDLGRDRSGHGTACASIVRRIAPACELTSLRVLTGLHGRADALIDGLRWAVDQRFDIVNMSLSTTRREFAPILRELTDDAYFTNTLIVASAHNMPVESFPWRFSSVISVGSHRELDSDLFLYNPEPPVEFFARGLNVPVALPGGGTGTCSGNSFATPHVTGLCALIVSKHPGLRPFQVKTALYLASSNVRRSG